MSAIKRHFKNGDNEICLDIWSYFYRIDPEEEQCPIKKHLEMKDESRGMPMVNLQ